MRSLGIFNKMAMDMIEAMSMGIGAADQEGFAFGQTNWNTFAIMFPGGEQMLEHPNTEELMGQLAAFVEQTDIFETWE